MCTPSAEVSQRLHSLYAEFELLPLWLSLLGQTSLSSWYDHHLQTLSFSSLKTEILGF